MKNTLAAGLAFGLSSAVPASALTFDFTGGSGLAASYTYGTGITVMVKGLPDSGAANDLDTEVTRNAIGLGVISVAEDGGFVEDNTRAINSRLQAQIKDVNNRIRLTFSEVVELDTLSFADISHSADEHGLIVDESVLGGPNAFNAAVFDSATAGLSAQQLTGTEFTISTA